MSENKPTYNPWAGLASYDDPQTAKYELQFCGRDNESYDVAKLIRNNIIVTLYGKSGIGKTSLINAGVIPDLREDGFMPLSIRLGVSNDDSFTNYQSIVIQAIESTSKDALVTIKAFDVIPEQTNVDAPDYLWNYFARHRFIYEDNSTIPVIVFDQFEEVLRTHRDKAEVLLRQLHYLSDKDHRIDNCEIGEEAYRYEFNFRFVISIREDDLYRLEDSIDNCYLASLKRCRYRLRSLSEDGAKDVVQIPGKGLFLKSEEDQIAKSIINIARNKEDGGINTYILSLVCYRIFLEYSNRGYEYIGQSLVDEFVQGNPFERYYDEATEGLSISEKEYLEEHFVDSTGRRNSISESDFHKNVPHGESLLHGDKRILQRISSSSGSNVYRVELLHDSFCDHLFERKQKRQQWQKLRKIGEYIGWLVVFGLIVILVFRIIDDSQELVRKEKNYTAAMSRKSDSVNQVLDSMNQVIDSVNQVIDSVNRDLEKAIGEKINLEKDKENLDNQKQKLTKDIDSLTRKEQELMAKVDQQDLQIAETKDENIELSKELNKIKFNKNNNYSRATTNDSILNANKVGALDLLNDMSEFEVSELWEKLRKDEEEFKIVLIHHYSEGDLKTLIKKHNKKKKEDEIQYLLKASDKDFVQRINDMTKEDFKRITENNPEIINRVKKNKKNIKHIN